MDPIIAAYPAEDDGDLMLCHKQGVAWQSDMTITASYDAAYFDKYLGYEDQPVANEINEGRIDFVYRHFGDGPVLDVGVGSGEFIKRRGIDRTFGFDVNPAAEAWLREQGSWRPDLEAFRSFTFWDVIEHIPEPDGYFDRMPLGSMLFTSIPVFSDLREIRRSRHYRPGEHLYYFTARGFIGWMRDKGFRHCETESFETAAGRDSIASFAFRLGPKR